jgi:archaellum component FlaC
LRREDGSFKDLYNGFGKAYPNITIAEKQLYSLDELITLADTVEGIEGWVVQFDKIMLKVKTKWYFENHRLMTGDINVEHKIIEMTLNETIDDVLSKIAEDAYELREFVNNISDTIITYVDNRVNTLTEVYNDCMKYYLQSTSTVLTKKDFVDYVNTNHKIYFKDMMFMFGKGSDIEILEEYTIKDTLARTNGLEKARQFLESIK